MLYIMYCILCVAPVSFVFLLLGSAVNKCNVTQAQELVSSLQVLQAVTPAVHVSLHPQVTLSYI